MVIAGTGFWLALANPRDRFHVRAREAARNLEEDLITTWPVITETCLLLVTRLHFSAQVKFIGKARLGWFQVFQLTSGHLQRVQELMEKYQELPMDLADASLVVLAEELGRGDILSTDQRDFNTYRWKSRYPFNNLLLL